VDVILWARFGPPQASRADPERTVLVTSQRPHDHVPGSGFVEVRLSVALSLFAQGDGARTLDGMRTRIAGCPVGLPVVSRRAGGEIAVICGVAVTSLSHSLADRHHAFFAMARALFTAAIHLDRGVAWGYTD
jgi:hypothetical protein